MARPFKVYGRLALLKQGLDMIGSKTTVSNKDAELEVTSLGLKMKSKKTKRNVLIPWGNLRGVELLPNANEDQEDVV